MTASADSNVDVILLDWAAGSLSLTSLLLFSSFKMTMRTSLLRMKQWHAWSCHLQLLQHSSKCSDIQQHFKKNAILCVWQLTQPAGINTSWLWIRIAFMYDSQWVLTWFSVMCSCTNKTFTLSSTRMTLVWEEWVYWVSCCWSTKRTESTSTAARTRTTTYAL